MNETQPSFSHISRRDALKIFGASLGALLAPQKSIQYLESLETQPNIKQRDEVQEVFKDTKDNHEKIHLYPKTEDEYDPEKISKLIEYVSTKYNLEIIFPLQTPSGEYCTPWRYHELEIIKNTLDALPNRLTKHSRFPTKIFLSKSKELIEEPSHNGLYAAGYGNREISIRISSSYDPVQTTEGTEANLFPTQEIYLSSALIHEIAHSFLESYPQLFNEWQKTFEWYQNIDGNWDTFQLEEIIYKNDIDKRPEEDFAVSVSLFIHNPSQLSKKRQNFLIRHIFLEG